MAVRYCKECGKNVKMPHSHKCPNSHKAPQDDPRPKQKLYAFWSYDLCPYYLGGQITEFLDNGRVKAKGYQNMTFKPLAILPDKAGENALNMLKDIREQWRIAEKNLKDKYKNAVEELIGLKEDKK